MHPDDFNIGYNLGSVAGVGIPNYIHCYIVPMWDGDTNITTIIAVVKVFAKGFGTSGQQAQEIFQKFISRSSIFWHAERKEK